MNYSLEKLIAAKKAYRGLAADSIESSASMTAGLLAISGVLITESATTELLLRAAHDLSGVVELLQKAASVPAAVRIRGLYDN
jgi:hypothetical protein